MSESAPVILMAVGDVMLGDHPICIGHGVGSCIKKKGSEFIFENVSEMLNTADIVFGNLESVLSDVDIDPSNINSVQLRASESSLKGLTFAGFNIMSIANNHILEHGGCSLERTIELLSGSGIKLVGKNENESGSQELTIFARKGISFGFLAYCLVRDKTSHCFVEDPSEILNNIKKVKKYVDILIVSLHWGNEYINKPSLDQCLLAHKMIDEGADLILGHHPHVLQGIEKYNDGVIVYSMGNFVFDMWQRKMRESMIFLCRFKKGGILNFEIMPCYINDYYQPSLMNGKEKDYLISNILNNFLDDIDGKSYEKAAKDCSNKYRIDLYKHLFKNFYRYKPVYLFQMFAEFIRKVR